MILLAALSAFQMESAAQQGVGVWGIPPSFSKVIVTNDGGGLQLDITLYDQNGGLDIFETTVEIFDDSGEILANATYRQHDGVLVYDVEDLFIDNYGGHLSTSDCEVVRTDGDYIQNNTLRVVFSFDDMEGSAAVKIFSVDHLGFSCFLETPVVTSDVPSTIYDNWFAIILADVLFLLIAVTLCIWYFSRKNE